MRRICILFGVVGLASLDARPAAAQLSVGFGPSARGTSTGRASGWEAAAQLTSALHFDHPLGLFALDATVERGVAGMRPGPAALISTLATPSFGGFRVVTTGSVDRDRTLIPPDDRRSTSTSLSYRSGSSGAWLGASAARFVTPGLIAGLWRQLGSAATISVGSTVHRTRFGRVPSNFYDSTYTDTGGWKRYPRFGTAADSVVPMRTWSVTEARAGWTVWRVALDGVVGWRPRIDSLRQSTWFQGFATVAITRNVALSLGAGSVTRQLPIAATSGRFGSVSLRFAPAALVRPNAPPQITPSASGFTVRRNADGDCVISVRLPRARVVELSGDFNGWKPLRLEQVGGDVWEAVIALAPGTYRMNVRVDGERWTAPPGTTAVDDDFNGRVGLVVVR